jgi:hypothetical protein
MKFRRKALHFNKLGGIMPANIKFITYYLSAVNNTVLFGENAGLDYADN